MSLIKFQVMWQPYFESSEKLALINLQQYTQKAKCILWVCQQSKLHSYVNALHGCVSNVSSICTCIAYTVK